jgi:4-hydroxy-tetrahydrodipicolinate synthase
MAEGCTGLAPFGTTSDANSLGLDERMEMLEELVDEGIEPATLMPGTGTCSLADTVVLTRHALDLECGGVLMLPPFYYKGPSEEGLFRYFAQVIEGVGDDKLRLYLYHIPPVAQVPITLGLIERLRKAYPDTVAGIKDSSGDWANTKAVLDAFGASGFDVFPGSETFLLAAMRAGAVGCNSATANINPGPIARLHATWQAADADRQQQGLDEIRTIMQSYVMIPALKAAIAHWGDDAAWATVRPPLVPLTEVQAADLVTKLETKSFQMPGLAV